MMTTRTVNAATAPRPQGGYSQAMEVSGPSRLLFISGQVPVDRDGTVPATFAEQAHLVWRNLDAQLTAAGMSFDNLVKVTTYLADRAYRDENGQVRRAVLGERTPALTVIIADIYDEAWLLEIEAVAAG